MREIKKFLENKKTFIVGAIGWAIMLIDQLSLLDLDLTVAETIALLLGSTGAITLRAALLKIQKTLGEPF